MFFESLQCSFFDSKSCSYLQIAVTRIAGSTVPKDSQKTLLSYCIGRSFSNSLCLPSPAGIWPHEAATPGLCSAGHHGVSASPTEGLVPRFGSGSAESQRQPLVESRNGCHRPGTLHNLQRSLWNFQKKYMNVWHCNDSDPSKSQQRNLPPCVWLA